MSWKFVLNASESKNRVEAYRKAEGAGYKFFLFNGLVFFRDEEHRTMYKTGIREDDLF